MIRELNSKEREIAITLLNGYNLPTDDISSGHVKLFGYFNSTDLIACVGIEEFENELLLRSLAVKNEIGTCGIGTMLTEFVGRYAYQNGNKTVYLLTESADGFFSKLRFKPCDRMEAPETIQQTKQFSTLCPDSAILMKLEF